MNNSMSSLCPNASSPESAPFFHLFDFDEVNFDQIDADKVVFLPRGRFEFAADLRDTTSAKPAAIVGCRDSLRQPIDYLAWSIATGQIATLYGAASLLGEEQLLAPRVEQDALRVFAGPGEWLRGKRRGVVVIDPTRARWLLNGQKLVVADAAFGRRLRAMLRHPEPQIFVDVLKEAAA